MRSYFLQKYQNDQYSFSLFISNASFEFIFVFQLDFQRLLFLIKIQNLPSIVYIYHELQIKYFQIMPADLNDISTNIIQFLVYLFAKQGNNFRVNVYERRQTYLPKLNYYISIFGSGDCAVAGYARGICQYNTSAVVAGVDL